MSSLNFTPRIASNENNCICGGHTCTEAAATPVESEVLHILQKEHTHALSLLRSSPLLSSLFVSYASRAPNSPVHSHSSSSSSSSSPSPIPSHDDERWSDLKTSFETLRTDHDKLRADYVSLMKQVEQDQREMTELRERFADAQHQQLIAETELVKAQGETKELQTKYDAALLKLQQKDRSQERMTVELESAHAEIEQWKTEHTALGQCVIDQQMEILRIKQKAVSNLEEVQFELANLQNRYEALDRSHTALLTETRRTKDVETPIPMFTEVKAPSSRRLDSTSEWEWPSPVADPPIASHHPPANPTPKIDITVAPKEPSMPTPQPQPSNSKFPLDSRENTTKPEANPAAPAPGILFRAKSFKSKSKAAKVSVRGGSSGDKENQVAKEGKGADFKVPWVLIKTDSEDTRESEKEHDVTKEKK